MSSQDEVGKALEKAEKHLADGLDTLRSKYVVEFEKERKEHPSLPEEAVKQIVENHMKELEASTVADCPEGLACAVKHMGIARVFLEEAQLRSGEDAMQRVLKAYDHLSHASDVHLAKVHKELAEKVREFRKRLEACALHKNPPCPPENTIKQAEELEREIVDRIKECPECLLERK